MSDGVVLIGLPGSGKTAVGRRVADRLGRPFVDIDSEIERISGCTPADLISTYGEPRMRAIEVRAVESAVGTAGAVIATGGGTVLDPLNRWRLMEHGTRIRLEASTEVLAARLRGDATPRPLLGEDLEDGLRSIADQRRAVYTAVDAVVDATGDIEATTRAACETVAARPHGWRPLLDLGYPRNHPAGPKLGRLLMGRSLDRTAFDVALGRTATSRAVFVCDRSAGAQLAALGADPGRSYVVDGGEQIKTMDELARLLGWLSEQRVERTDALVVIGGGTVGDLGGLAAALHRRGIPLVNVPTTWLAQADSAIGGKVAVDLPHAKNAVGTFWPAWLIASDVDALLTLPAERRRDGLAECLKCGLIGDPVLWQLIEERGPRALASEDPAAAYAMTERAARLKLDICARDPFEAGERRTLNLGHTIGHALEIESGYSLAHGAAVALGLRAVATIARGRGAEGNLEQRIDAVLTALGFGLTRRFDRAAVVAATLGDKKRAGGVQRWILPMAVGRVEEVDDVTDAEFDSALEAIAA